MLSYKYKVFALIILLFLCSVGILISLCYDFSNIRINRITDSMSAPRGRVHLSVENESALIGLDERLKNNINSYKGYIYEFNVLNAEVNFGNKVSMVPVMLVNRTMLEEAAFFRLKKGQTLSFDGNDRETVILAGDHLANINLNTPLSITLFSEDGQTSREIAARVSGKADKLYALPEYKRYSSKDFLEYSQNLILLSDTGAYDDLFTQRRNSVVLLNDYMSVYENQEYIQLIEDQSGIAQLDVKGGYYMNSYYLPTVIISVIVCAISLILIHFYINKLLQSINKLYLSSQALSLLLIIAVALSTILITVFVNLTGSWRSLRFGYALLVFAISQLPLFLKIAVTLIVRAKTKKAEKDMHYEKI